MKLPFAKIAALALGFTLSASQADAIIYTAAKSGNYTDPATWGGVAPPTNLGANSLSITNFVITLDANVTIATNTSTLQLYGNARIVSANNEYLSITNGQFSSDLLCAINVDSLYLSTSLGVNFSGSMTVNKLTLSGATLQSGTRAVAMRQLVLTGAPSTISFGAIFSLGIEGAMNRAKLIMRGGSIVPQGTVTFFPFDVRYESTANNLDIFAYEFGHDSLVNIEVALPSATSALNLGVDFKLKHELLLTRGILNLNAQKLEIADSATVNGAGTLNLIPLSTLKITSVMPDIGTLRFEGAGGEALDNLEMNTPSPTSVIHFTSDIEVLKKFTLTSGIIHLKNSKIIATNRDVELIGGSDNSYVITEGTAAVRLAVDKDSVVVFHIGSVGGYAPVQIANKGVELPLMTIGVIPGVKENGTTGNDLAATKPVVNATWTTTHSGNLTNVEYDITPMWTSAMEVNGFDRTKQFVSKYTSNRWEVNTPAAATAVGTLFSGTQAGVKSFGIFSIFDATAISVKDVHTGRQISVYPNPTTDVLRFSLNGAANVQATILSTTGSVVGTATLNAANNTMQVAQLPAGVYYIQLAGADVNGTAKFVKQ